MFRRVAPGDCDGDCDSDRDEWHLPFLCAVQSSETQGVGGSLAAEPGLAPVHPLSSPSLALMPRTAAPSVVCGRSSLSLVFEGSVREEAIEQTNT